MSVYRQEGESSLVTTEKLSRADSESQIEVMRNWFLDNYEDPAERTPCESSEGGYIYIWGGPFDSRDVLENEFDGVVSQEVINILVKELNSLCTEWSGKPGSD